MRREYDFLFFLCCLLCVSLINAAAATDTIMENLFPLAQEEKRKKKKQFHHLCCGGVVACAASCNGNVGLLYTSADIKLVFNANHDFRLFTSLFKSFFYYTHGSC